MIHKIKGMQTQLLRKILKNPNSPAAIAFLIDAGRKRSNANLPIDHT
jgi:hypothetical protein